MIHLRDLPLPSTAQREIRALLTVGSPPYVSLYMPLQRTWDGSQHDQTLLRTLTETAHRALRDRGLSSDAPDTLLTPLHEFRNTPETWPTDANGLVLFAAQGHHAVFPLPTAPEASVHVDERYHIRPLWDMLAVDGTFFVLGLAKGGVKLFRGSRHAMTSIPLSDVPTSLEEATQYDDPSSTLGYHTRAQTFGGGPSSVRAARYFGQEDHRTNVKDQILQFFQQLDNGVQEEMNKQVPRPPLILAGIDYLQGLYRKASSYDPLLLQGIDGPAIGGPSSRDWNENALHEEGWTIAADYFNAERQTAVQRHEQLQGSTPHLTAATLSTVVPAAVHGRVDTLFVPLHTEAWGQFDPHRHAMTIRDEGESATTDTELYNLATASTLLSSGTVYTEASDNAKAEPSIRATLRY